MSNEDEDSKKNPRKTKNVGRKAKNKPKHTEASTIEKLQAKYDSIDANQIKTFADFPISAKTLTGLRQCGYHKPTDIQRQAIGFALQGKDILGAAQTGTGKTLAFLIPLIEKLYCKLWTGLDGLGALVITPTRELAYQIFQTLRAVGKFHDFSAGLIIGGKDLKFERTRMDQCNIIICTPGRLLQHMDENPLFDCVNLQILILDEADRCLDMGFEQTMNAIIANLPPKRQTLLFSATQTKSVKDLVRLSLKDPSYISAYEHSESITPKELLQNYVVCELQDKVSILWSFIKNHLKNKTIVFFSSCKQAKYMHEIFCKLRPGISLLALYGTLHQLRRVDIYESFCRKDHAVLFATDLAARGLDFPLVNWVIQVDCPEDVTMYIHRVGRTARFLKGGQSLLMLLPREIKMIDKLTEKKIPIEKIDINPMKLNNPVRKMEAYLAKNPELKASAQRAFVSYAKAVFLMKDKDIFDVQSLDVASFASSFGLAIPPRIRFLQRLNAKAESSKKENNNRNNKIYFNDDESDNLYDKTATNTGENNDSVDSGVSADANPQPKSSFHVPDSEGSDDDAILKVKRKDHDIELPTSEEIADLNLGRNKNKKPLTKAAAAKKILKKKIVPNKKIVFNDEGDAIVPGTKEKKSELALQYENEDEGGIDIEKAKMVLKEEDKFDKELFKQKVKAKHKEKKRKLKEEKKKKQEEEKDEFGESESEVEPDLSWLPDPDRIYGEKTEEEVEKLGEDMHINLDEEEESGEKKELRSASVKDKLPKKRKLKGKASNLETEPKRKKKQKIEKVSSLLEPDEVEELAMMLLRNK